MSKSVLSNEDTQFNHSLMIYQVHLVSFFYYYYKCFSTYEQKHLYSIVSNIRGLIIL